MLTDFSHAASHAATQGSLTHSEEGTICPPSNWQSAQGAPWCLPKVSWDWLLLPCDPEWISGPFLDCWFGQLLIFFAALTICLASVVFLPVASLFLRTCLILVLALLIVFEIHLMDFLSALVCLQCTAKAKLIGLTVPILLEGTVNRMDLWWMMACENSEVCLAWTMEKINVAHVRGSELPTEDLPFISFN